MANDKKKDCCGNCKAGLTCVSDIKAENPHLAKEILKKQKAVSTGKIIEK